MSWTFAEERPIYWEEPPEQIAITNVETGKWDFYMLTSKAMRMIRDVKDDANWLHAELHGAEDEIAKLREENQRIGLIAYELGRKGLAQENVEWRENGWGTRTRHCGACGADLDCDTRNTQNYCPNCGAKVVEE